MAFGLLRSVGSLVSACSKRVSRAVRRLRCGPSLSRRSVVHFLGGSSKKIAEGGKEQRVAEERGVESDGGDGVWRRTILMGEKCQPLDFSGVIYYDADGKRLREVPPPRSPLRSPLHSFSLVTAGDK